MPTRNGAGGRSSAPETPDAPAPPPRAEGEVLAFLRSLLLPRSTPELIGTVLGALSVLSLAQTAHESGFGPAFTVMIGYYDRLIQALLLPLQPVASALVAAAASLVPIRIELQPSWKHVFVLMGIYYFRSAQAALFLDGDRLTAAFRFVLGAVVALAIGAATSAVSADHASSAAAVWIALFPVLGNLIYGAFDAAWDSARGLIDPVWDGGAQALRMPSRSEHLLGALRGVLTRGLGGAALALITFFLTPVASLANPGIATLAVLIFALSLYWLLLGTFQQAPHIRRAQGPAGSWLGAVRRSSGVRLGSSMVKVFVLFLILVAISAGLSRYDL